MNKEIIKELLKKLKQCDDFHNRCDFLMEHSEITYMLDYITNLQQENQKLKEQNETIQEKFKEWKKDIEKERKFYLCERDCAFRLKESKKYLSYTQQIEQLKQENKQLKDKLIEINEVINGYMPNQYSMCKAFDEIEFIISKEVK